MYILRIYMHGADNCVACVVILVSTKCYQLCSTCDFQTYNLGEPSDSKNVDPGCSRGVARAVSFGINTNFLVAILVCIAILLSECQHAVLLSLGSSHPVPSSPRVISLLCPSGDRKSPLPVISPYCIAGGVYDAWQREKIREESGRTPEGKMRSWKTYAQMGG
jgi:hypothetical protein